MKTKLFKLGLILIFISVEPICGFSKSMIFDLDLILMKGHHDDAPISKYVNNKDIISFKRLKMNNFLISNSIFKNNLKKEYSNSNLFFSYTVDPYVGVPIDFYLKGSTVQEAIDYLIFCDDIKFIPIKQKNKLFIMFQEHMAIPDEGIFTLSDFPEQIASKIWKINNNGEADLKDYFKKLGIQLRDNNRFSVKFYKQYVHDGFQKTTLKNVVVIVASWKNLEAVTRVEYILKFLSKNMTIHKKFTIANNKLKNPKEISLKKMEEKWGFKLIKLRDTKNFNSTLKFDLKLNNVSINEALDIIWYKYSDGHFDSPELDDNSGSPSTCKIINDNELSQKFISFYKKNVSIMDALNILLFSTDYSYFIKEGQKKELFIFNSSVSSSLNIPNIKSYKISEKIVNILGYKLISGYLDITDYFVNRKIIASTKGKILCFNSVDYNAPFILFINLNNEELKAIKTVLFLIQNGFEVK